MAIGMPIVGLATTELVTVVENGVSGYVSTDINWLIEGMQALIDDPELARRLSAGAKKQAEARFGIDRFVRDWNEAWETVMSGQSTFGAIASFVPKTFIPPLNLSVANDHQTHCFN